MIVNSSDLWCSFTAIWLFNIFFGSINTIQYDKYLIWQHLTKKGFFLIFDYTILKLLIIRIIIIYLYA